MKTLALICLVFSSSLSYAVNLVINPAPVTAAQCPLNGINYTVSRDGGGSLPSCTYNWVVTGGTILSGQGTTTVSIKWNVEIPSKLTTIFRDNVTTESYFTI